MGLTADLQTDLAEAFDSDLADAVKNFVLHQYQRGQYDTNTGGLSGTKYPSTFDSRGVFGSFSKEDILNSNIDAVDVQLVVLQNELPLIGVVVIPIIGDQIIRTADSKEFRVAGVNPDPADATWIIHLKGVG